MRDPDTEEVSLELLVAEMIDDFRERQKRGERPDIEEYATRHPQYAAVLREVLASLRLLGVSLGSPRPAEPEIAVAECLGDFRLLGEVGRGSMGVVS